MNEGRFSNSPATEESVNVPKDHTDFGFGNHANTVPGANTMHGASSTVLDLMNDGRSIWQSLARSDLSIAASYFDRDKKAILKNFGIKSDQSKTENQASYEKNFNAATGEGVDGIYSIVGWNYTRARRVFFQYLSRVADQCSPQRLAEAISDGKLTHDERANLYNELWDRRTHDGSWGANQFVKDLNTRLAASNSDYRIFQMEGISPDCKYEIRNIRMGSRADEIVVQLNDDKPKPTLSEMALNAAAALADGKLQPGEQGALEVLAAAFRDGKHEGLRQAVGQINSILMTAGSQYRLAAQIGYSPGPPIESQPHRNMYIEPTLSDVLNHTATKLPSVGAGMDNRTNF